MFIVVHVTDFAVREDLFSNSYGGTVCFQLNLMKTFVVFEAV
jgi:hypothetical protein